MHQMQPLPKKISTNSKKPVAKKNRKKGYFQSSYSAINISYPTEQNTIQQRPWEQEPVVQRTIDRNTGKIIARSAFPQRIYNSAQYHWGFYDKFMARKHQKKPPFFCFADRNFQHQIGSADKHTLHHLIDLSTLERFWNILVEYYPDLWGGMMKKILTNMSNVVKNGNSIYHEDFVDQLTSRENVKREDIDAEIDREQALLEQKAFQNIDIDLNVNRPDAVGEVPDLLENVYAWMPGNLVVGPLATERSDDPGSGFDTAALYQKRLSKKKKEKEYKDLYKKIQDFNNETKHNDRKQYKINPQANIAADKLTEIQNLEKEARDIIDKIATLLAGNEITNNTVWKRDSVDSNSYSSPEETASIIVR